MTSVNTKQLFMEKARQLFAKSGFENTTMNDIAEASQRGRRTLYT
ncbi:MAG: helix-turn-helix transcriptional regulator, partial [Bacteroidales bacterium]|nr:helix-turn-helix transcriptional regulator [Bacteroidales bacterium]